MKNRYLKREFQAYVLFTAGVIALLALFTFWFCNLWQDEILPNKTQLYIDAVSTYADGTTHLRTYSLELADADGKEQFVEENTIEDKKKERENTEEGLVLDTKDGSSVRFAVTYPTLINDSVLPEDGTSTDNPVLRENVTGSSTDNQNGTSTAEHGDDGSTDNRNGASASGNSSLSLEQYQFDTDDLLSENSMLVDSSQIQTKTQFTVSKIENSFSKLPEQKQRLYQLLSYAKVGLPILYSIIGILVSSFLFYGRRIAKPVFALERAAERISSQDLDFEVSSDSKNELGRLCDSFELMRQSLQENNHRMMKTLEEKRLLQASVSHDLRNPLTIMKGYLELMESGMRAHTCTEEQLLGHLSHVQTTADRMSDYVESIHEINCLEEMDLRPEPVALSQCVKSLRETVELLVDDKEVLIIDSLSGVSESSVDPSSGCDSSSDLFSGCDPSGDLSSGCDPSSDPSSGCDPSGDPSSGCDPSGDPFSGCDPSGDLSSGCDPSSVDPSGGNVSSGSRSSGGQEERWMLDRNAILRILENVAGNSSRYAKSRIRVHFSADREELVIKVSDDGPGYPEKLLRNPRLYFYTSEKSGHLGMGMAICRILCEKHGGGLDFYNGSGGGAVTVIRIRNLVPSAAQKDPKRQLFRD